MTSDMTRYSRQTILPQIGVAGQKRLRDASVLVIGAGGLGSPVLQYLAAAGVGRLGVVDMDRVEASNLQRQVVHGEADLGREKTASAKDSVLRIDSSIRVDTFNCLVNSENVDDILAEYEIGVGCVDDITTRYVLDAACVRQGKPHVFGAVSGFEGQAGIFADKWPCYRCLFREPPEEGWKPGELEKGIVGSVAGVIGCIQATETIKSLLGVGRTLGGRLLLFDGLTMQFREMRIKPDPDCPVCGPAAET